MKKIFSIIIASTVFAIMVMPSCNSSSSKLDKFMGEWKRIDKVDDNFIIKKEDDAILLIQKKDTLVARYDKKNNALKFWVLSSATITYNEKNDHLLLLLNNGKDLLFNNRKDGEAKRVK